MTTKFCTISDTHGYMPVLKPCDVLIICGDICPVYLSHKSEIQTSWLNNDFKKWVDQLKSQGIGQVIVVAGNHDFAFEQNLDKIDKSNYIYLHESSTVINGIKIYGTPYQPWFYDWAFNLDKHNKTEPALTKRYATIPDDTNILVTHCPPYGVLDFVGLPRRSVGSRALAERIKNLKQLKYHLFGHIHTNSANESRIVNRHHLTCINSSVLNNDYKLVYDPIYFEI